MFPWNYGFHWNSGTLIFLGAFYTVLVVVVTTVATALWRSVKDARSRKEELIRWESEFHDLPARDRECRHVLTGELRHRECPNAFDCRQCLTHAKLTRTWDPIQTGGVEDDAFGLSFPLDRVYHRGHTWLRREVDGTVTVGLDDLGSRVLGQPDSVELPKVGDRIEVNGTAWTAHKRNAAVRLLSPVDGEVVATGGPGAGWYLRVRPDRYDIRHLLRAHEIRPWLSRELERLQVVLSSEGAAAPSLADGGVPVEDIAAAYPNADWDAVCGSMFLEP